MTPTNEYGQPHGLCICYYDNGNVSFKKRYFNGIAHGIREWYHYDRELHYKNYIKYDKCVYTEWYGSINEIEFTI